MLLLLRDWKGRYGHLPWHRRYEFLGPALVAVLVAGFLLLPPGGKPADTLSWIRIVLSYVLLFGWVLLILADNEKPVWLKRVLSLSSVSALDPEMIREVLDVMLALAKDGMTMVVVSHEIGFIREASTRILVPDGGCVFEEGVPGTLLRSPQQEKTRQFLGKIL